MPTAPWLTVISTGFVDGGVMPPSAMMTAVAAAASVSGEESDPRRRFHEAAVGLWATAHSLNPSHSHGEPLLYFVVTNEGSHANRIQLALAVRHAETT